MTLNKFFCEIFKSNIQFLWSLKRELNKIQFHHASGGAGIFEGK